MTENEPQDDSEKIQNNNSSNQKMKPIIRCIFCEKFENQFRHIDGQNTLEKKSTIKSNESKEKKDSKKRKKAKKKSSKKFNKEDSINGVQLESNNINEEVSSEPEKEKEKNENKV